MNNPSEFEEVSKLKTGAVRENSLFNYIDDCINSADPVEQHTFKNKYRCTKSSGERLAYFISPLNLEKTASLILDGYDLIDCHLSVDKNHSLETSASASSYYTASHITLILKKTNTTQQGRVIRVYFNQLNQLIADPMHMVACTLNENRVIQQNESLTIDGPLMDAVYSNEQFQQHKIALNDISEAKCKKYMDERSFSYQLSERLAYEIRDKQWLEAKQTAQELKKLTENITRYHDTLIDTRTQYLHKLIAFYDQFIDKPVVMTPNQQDLNAKQGAVEASMASLDLVKDPLPATLSSENVLKKDIEALVESIQSIMSSTELSFTEKLIQRHSALEKLEECCLILSFTDGNSRHINRFIKTQKAKIASDTMSLLEHFKQALEQGNLDQLKQLHEPVSGYYDLSLVYADFVGRMIGDTETIADSDTMRGRLAIADYLFTSCPVYQSKIKLVHATMFGFTDDTIRSCLLRCFIQDNEEGFKLLLRQGASLHDMHFTILGTKIAFNALQAVIFYYTRNPKLHYIQWMIEHGARMTFSKQWVHITQSYKLNKNNTIKSSQGMLGSVSRKSGKKSDNNALIDIVEKLLIEPNALTFNMKLADNYPYPEVSELLIKQIPSEDAMMALLKILNSITFHSVHFMVNAKDQPDISHQIDDSQIIFKNRDSLMNHVNASIPNALIPNDCYIIRVFYYVSDLTPNSDVVFDYMTSIWNAVKAKFQHESMEDQKWILTRMFLMQKRVSTQANMSTSTISMERMHFITLLHYSIELAYRWMATHTDEKLNSRIQNSFKLVHKFTEQLLMVSYQLSKSDDENIRQTHVRITEGGDYFAKHLTTNRKNSSNFFQSPASLNEAALSTNEYKMVG